MSGWHSEIAASTGNVGKYNSLALDSGDYPHISFFDETNDDLMYAYQDAGGWHVETVDGPGWNGWYTSLALDGDDEPHIGYLGANVRYAYQDATGWHTSTVDTEVYIGEFISLDLDAGDTPHLSYADVLEDNVLRHATWTGSAWQLETVDRQGEFGEYPSLALGPDQRPHISYEVTGEGLKYAHLQAGGWLTQTIDPSAVGCNTSLQVGLDGHPRIAYVKGWPDNVLQFAYRDASGWYTETVDAGAGDVGQYASLALDGAGYAHIGYFDDTNDDLHYAYQDAAGWHTTTVDSAGYAGRFTSLELDSVGYPHISYIGDGDLRYAYRDMNGWYTETVDSSHSFGFGTSLALDPAGYPHISYFDDSNENLIYAYQDGGGWQIEVVDSLGWVGENSSLTLDQNGYPHITYWDRKTSSDVGWDLNYAYQNLAGWHLQTLDGTGFAGKRSSLALDQNDKPHVAYQDDGAADLVYAYFLPGTPFTLTLDGPEAGVIGVGQTFTATVTPLTTTVPITYAWEATGQEAFTETGGLVSTASFTWVLPGTRHITVTAANRVGEQAAETRVEVGGSGGVYLPIVLKGYPPATRSSSCPPARPRISSA